MSLSRLFLIAAGQQDDANHLVFEHIQCGKGWGARLWPLLWLTEELMMVLVVRRRWLNFRFRAIAFHRVKPIIIMLLSFCWGGLLGTLFRISTILLLLMDLITKLLLCLHCCWSKNGRFVAEFLIVIDAVLTFKGLPKPVNIICSCGVLASLRPRATLWRESFPVTWLARLLSTHHLISAVALAARAHVSRHPV